ncbi:MAG: hypothetical protein MI924_34455 [Chloroflexales bacterium]|nr:hypothetical protein [Chloroflexales bacterium]
MPRHISATPMAAGFSRAPAAVKQTVIREVTERLSHYETNGQARIPLKSHMIMGKQ